MISYFATDPDPAVFHLELEDFAVTKAMLKSDKAKLDIPATVSLGTNPSQKIDPTDDYKRNHECNGICLKAYGYLLKRTPEKDSAGEDTGYVDGTVVPITRGRVKQSWWTRQFMRGCQFVATRCTCETRDDFLKLLAEFNIDPKPFELRRKVSSTQALRYLRDVLRHIGESLQWLNHAAFTELLKDEMAHHGLRPMPEMMTYRELREAYREVSGTAIERADDSFWEEMQFYRSPKPHTDLPSPSVVAKLRDEGKLEIQ